MTFFDQATKLAVAATVIWSFASHANAAAVDEYGTHGTIPGVEFTGGDGSYKRAVADGIICGICPAFPFTYEDPKTGQYKGLDVDIVTEAARRVGITKIKFSIMPFSDLIPSLVSQRVDIAVDNLHLNPDRIKVIQFTSPAYFYGGAIAVRKENPANVTTWASLAGKAIGVNLGSFYDDVLKRRKDLGRLEEYPTSAVQYGDLIAGRIDAMYDDETKIQSFLEKNPGANIKITDVQIPSELQFGYARYGLRKSDVDLNWAISRGIDEMRADGTLAKMLPEAKLKGSNMFNYPLN